METIRHNRRSIIIAFILSLLFHAILIIYLLWQKTNPINNMPIPTPEEIAKRERAQDEQWAETKARAGNFGAPVFFNDMPEVEAQPENIQEQPTEEEQPSFAEASEGEPETKKIELERHIDISEPEEISTQLPPQQETTTIQRPQHVKPPHKQERPVQRQPQKTAPRPIQQQPRIPTPKQLPTLAQLTQGFLHQARNEGTHTIHMLGKRNGQPTDEQMKYERYLQKLNWCLQNSFSINNNRFPSSDRLETDAHIFLALDKDGKIKQLNLAKSSGNKLLDQFVLFVFRDASSSFPPVPQYLPHNPFTIMYTVTLNPSDNNFRFYRH
jgi:TonB family protein